MGDLNSWTAVLVPVIVAIGGLVGVGGVGGVIVTVYKTWKEDKQKTKTDSLTEWKEISARDQALLEKQNARVAQLENDLRTANDRGHDWQLKHERAAAYVRYMAAACEAKGVTLLHYDPDTSTVHAPLPADGKRSTP